MATRELNGFDRLREAEGLPTPQLLEEDAYRSRLLIEAGEYQALEKDLGLAVGLHVGAAVLSRFADQLPDGGADLCAEIEQLRLDAADRLGGPATAELREGMTAARAAMAAHAKRAGAVPARAPRVARVRPRECGRRPRRVTARRVRPSRAGPDDDPGPGSTCAGRRRRWSA